MYIESIPKIIKRIKRTIDRFKNADLDINNIAEPFIERVRNCNDINSATKVEKEFNEYCRIAFPVLKEEILSPLKLYQSLDLK